MAIKLGPRVLIADDHAPTRAMVRKAIEDEGFLVCAEVADAKSAIRAADETRPDIAILDIRMPGGGILAANRIATEQPDVLIVMLTVSDEDQDLFSALSAGASGYVLKGQDPASIPEALRMVLAGEAALSGSLVKRLLRDYRVRESRHRVTASLPKGKRLTPREVEVLELLNEGLATTEIGTRLFVADVTVRTHIAAIMRKLDVNDRAGLLRLVREPFE